MEDDLKCFANILQNKLTLGLLGNKISSKLKAKLEYRFSLTKLEAELKKINAENGDLVEQIKQFHHSQVIDTLKRCFQTTPALSISTTDMRRRVGKLPCHNLKRFADWIAFVCSKQLVSDRTLLIARRRLMKL